MSESPAEARIAEAIAARPIHGQTSPSPTATLDIARSLPIPLDSQDESDE